jgi:hypothetical protein
LARNSLKNGSNNSPVGGTGRQTRVALAAHLGLALVRAGEHLERRLDDAAAQTQHQVQRRLLLDVVVGQRAAVLQLLARKDQPLLVRRNAFLVLDLLLDLLDRVAYVFDREIKRKKKEKIIERKKSFFSFSSLFSGRD